MSKEKEIEMQESETVEEPKNFKFFSHRACEFFPCHAVKDPEQKTIRVRLPEGLLEL